MVPGEAPAQAQGKITQQAEEAVFGAVRGHCQRNGSWPAGLQGKNGIAGWVAWGCGDEFLLGPKESRRKRGGKDHGALQSEPGDAAPVQVQGGMKVSAAAADLKLLRIRKDK